MDDIQELKKEMLKTILSNIEGEDIGLEEYESIQWFEQRGYSFDEAKQMTFDKYRAKLLSNDEITHHIIKYKDAYTAFDDDDEFDNEKFYKHYINSLAKTFSTICDFSLENNKLIDPKGVIKHIKEIFVANEIVQSFVREREYKESQLRKYEALNTTVENKSDKLGRKMAEFGFLELPKVSCLSEKSKEQLIVNIATNSLPYSIAMLEFLDFIKHLLNNNFKTKYQLHREISKWFNSDIDGRYIRGLLNHLHKNDSERYTAYQHINKVEEDYNKLK